MARIRLATLSSNSDFRTEAGSVEPECFPTEYFVFEVDLLILSGISGLSITEPWTEPATVLQYETMSILT